MAAAGQEILIKDAMVFFFAAGVAVPVFRTFKIPAVVGFMLSGIALGPFGVGSLADDFPILEYISISEPSAAAPFAELGVLFLLFLLGLEFSFQRLWALRKTVFGVGGMQASLSALAVGSIAFLFGFNAEIAMICGLALALSSTAIVMQLLVDSKTAATPVGRTSFGVLLFQDILVAPILIFVGLLSLDDGEQLSRVLIEALIQGLAALAIIILIGRFLLRRVFQMVASAGGRDFLLALTLLTVVGAAAITASAGLSLALGAFLAGLLLGETEFKHQTEVDLEPFKGILLGLFFMTVGMGLDLNAIMASPAFIISGVLLLLIVKLAVGFLAVRTFNKNWRTAVEVSFLLAPAGEFAFVVIAAATASGILVSEIGATLTAIAGIAMLLIPGMARIGQALANINRSDEPEAVDEDYTDRKGHIVIAGYGRVGQVIARVLEHEEADVVILDLNALNVLKARKEGFRAYLGDASRPELLQSIGMDGAAQFISTVNDPPRVEEMVKSVRKMRPGITILARAHDQEHAEKLETIGANYVVPEVVEAGLQIAGEALHGFGYETETIRNLLAADRDAEYHRSERDENENRSKEKEPGELVSGP